MGPQDTTLLDRKSVAIASDVLSLLSTPRSTDTIHHNTRYIELYNQVASNMDATATPADPAAELQDVEGHVQLSQCRASDPAVGECGQDPPRARPRDSKGLSH